MKKVTVTYQPDGQIELILPDDFEMTKDAIHDHLLANASDQTILENVERSGPHGEIEPDALHITSHYQSL